MIILRKRKKHIFRMENVYFAENYDSYTTDGDVVLFYSSARKPDRHYYGKPAPTLLISLEPEEEELFRNLRKSTRQDISRALKNDRITMSYVSNPTKDQISEFCDYFDQFARQKGISRADREHLEELHGMGLLALCYALDEKNQPICGEVDILIPSRGYGAYAFSMFRMAEDRKLVGQANKLLYWISLVNAKKHGCQTYDMGGIAGSEESRELEGIDNFKLGFGGSVVEEYSFYKGYTLKGKLLVLFFRIIQKRFDFWD